MQRVSNRGALLSSDLQLEAEQQHLLGAGLCETDGQLSPITAQLYAGSSLWANHNGPEEANGNEACLLVANRERGGVAQSNSSGGKIAFETRLPPHHRTTSTHIALQLVVVVDSDAFIAQSQHFTTLHKSFATEFFNDTWKHRDLQTQKQLSTFGQFQG